MCRELVSCADFKAILTPFSEVIWNSYSSSKYVVYATAYVYRESYEPHATHVPKADYQHVVTSTICAYSFRFHHVEPAFQAHFVALRSLISKVAN